MILPTFITTKSKLSVCVNGFFLPFKEVPDSMQRYVRPALFSTGDEIFELQFSGTALMATYQSWRFALVTAHQAEGKNFTTSTGAFVVVVDRGNERVAIPPSSAHSPKFMSDNHLSLEDIIFFDYDEVQSEVKPQHIDLSKIFWSDSPDLTADYSFVIGYPTKSVRIELDPADEIQLKEFTLGWIRQDLERAEPQLMDLENRSIFVKHPESKRLSIDPDGLSGSPVFSIVRADQNDRHLRFDGIVTNANGDRFAVYPSEHIRDSLEEIRRKASTDR